MSRLDRVLDGLEASAGPVAIPRAADPYKMLVHSMCGYPASDEACAKGLAALEREVGTSVDEILRARPERLVKAMREGGIVAEKRADRLREIASRVKFEFEGDLRGALRDPKAGRKVLKTFPTIGDPGADKILLFTRADTVAAVPSNATQVPVRLGFGSESSNYATTYRSVQQTLDAELPRTHAARIRAYLLLRRHGQTLCKRTRPACEPCPVRRDCPYGKR